MIPTLPAASEGAVSGLTDGDARDDLTGGQRIEVGRVRAQEGGQVGDADAVGDTLSLQGEDGHEGEAAESARPIASTHVVANEPAPRPKSSLRFLLTCSSSCAPKAASEAGSTVVAVE